MKKLNFKPFPNLESERLIFRQLKLSDAPIIFSLHADMENRKYIDKPAPKNIKESEKFIHKINTGINKSDFIYWGICLKESKKLIGTICLWNFSENNKKVELGYELGKAYQGVGYMGESINMIVEFGFKMLNVSCIEAYTHIDNKASSNLLKKKEFEKIKEIKETYFNEKGHFKMEVFILKR